MYCICQTRVWAALFQRCKRQGSKSSFLPHPPAYLTRIFHWFAITGGLNQIFCDRRDSSDHRQRNGCFTPPEKSCHGLQDYLTKHLAHRFDYNSALRHRSWPSQKEKKKSLATSAWTPKQNKWLDLWNTCCVFRKKEWQQYGWAHEEDDGCKRGFNFHTVKGSGEHF